MCDSPGFVDFAQPVVSIPHFPDMVELAEMQTLEELLTIVIFFE